MCIYYENTLLCCASDQMCLMNFFICEGRISRGTIAVMGSLEALPHLEAVSRLYFHCLGLGLDPHCLGVWVLPLLSWSCASRPRQFKTPVERPRHQPTDSPIKTQLAKHLTMIKCEDFDPDEQPAVYTLPQFNSLWSLFSGLWCVPLPVTSALVERSLYRAYSQSDIIM